MRSRETDVAEQVRKFYDLYPYPRPIDSLEGYGRVWQNPRRRRAEHHLFWPSKPYREDHAILIAGCGTSQAAKHAIRWPNARVVGIDFSAASVRCTEELKRKYRLNNLEIHQLSIERVDDLGITFDQIVCTGVLHHLTDPDTGLRALRNALNPDGTMHLMVYAPYGRAGIYILQEFCRRIGIQTNDADIRELMIALRELPPGHPLENLLRQAPDFREESTLADALLHPHDRAYSVPQLFDFIKNGELKFARWLRQAPYLPQCGVIAKIPQTTRIAQLTPEEQYAAVELFRGTMVNHSLILYRNDTPVSPQPVNFNGNSWLRYVPIRMPDTICVHERLPPGAAGVLINQTHTYRDLIMPINETEMEIFNAIDGTSTTNDILNRTSKNSQENPLGRVRAFFERLWQYDQAVFQALT